MIDWVGVIEQVRAVDVTPLVLAVILSGAIGLERKLHSRPAGVRTHILVCLCATVLMRSSTMLLPAFDGGEANVVFDPQRLAAGIVTGIGFLGAGAVVRSGDIVRGVTTGATVWCVAGLGVVLGQGAYGQAIVMTAMALFVLVVLDRIPSRFGTVVYRRLSVRASGPDMEGLVDRVHEVLRVHRTRVQEISGAFAAGLEEDYELQFHVRCRNALRAPLILEGVRGIRGVRDAAWSAR